MDDVIPVAIKILFVPASENAHDIIFDLVLNSSSIAHAPCAKGISRGPNT